jgi:hypothetical protein
MKILTKSFKLDERDVSYIQKVAKKNGESGESAALRAIIREHRQLSAIMPDLTTVTLTDKAASLSNPETKAV